MNNKMDEMWAALAAARAVYAAAVYAADDAADDAAREAALAAARAADDAVYEAEEAVQLAIDEIKKVMNPQEEMMNKSLFVLRHGKGGAFVKGPDGKLLYFSDKLSAKKVRDEMGGDTVVSYGPMHKKFSDTSHVQILYTLAGRNNGGN
jgi:hypothetical protein